MKVLLIVLLVILLVAIVGLVVFMVVKKKKQGGNQGAAAAQPQSRGRESRRGRGAKGKKSKPAPEPDVEDTSFLFEEEQQTDTTPQPSLQDIVDQPQQQQQVQEQPKYQSGTETLKRRTGSIETIATELIQEMANAISQSNITALTSCVREPLLQPLATSIYSMRQNGIARDLSFKSIKGMTVVSTSLIGDNEFYILTADVEYTDYLIRGNEVIGMRELVYSKKIKTVVTQDITVNGVYSLTNINI